MGLQGSTQAIERSEHGRKLTLQQSMALLDGLLVRIGLTVVDMSIQFETFGVE